MFKKEELDIIFKVFKELETDDEETKFLKQKMEILNEQRNVGDSANKMIAELQQKLVDLEKSRNTLENENKEV